MNTRNASPLAPKAVIMEDAEGLHVEVKWIGAPLDRPVTGGWLLARGHDALAVRLARAIDAGAVFRNPHIKTDALGKTYVQADSVRMLGRTLNADLRAIGF